MKPSFELLAPAGDMERLEAALRFGADAVYLGGPMLQLRAGSVGFSMEELAAAVQAVHAKGKRIYVAVNAFASNADVDAAAEYARALHKMGVDAAIVSDLGLICTLRLAALPKAIAVKLATLAIPVVLLLLMQFAPAALRWAVPAALVLYAIFYLSFNRLITASYANACCEKYLNPKIEGAGVDIGLRRTEHGEESKK